jgi:hypothetical protein
MFAVAALVAVGIDVVLRVVVGVVIGAGHGGMVATRSAGVFTLVSTSAYEFRFWESR